jgi:hypothetical protein
MVNAARRSGSKRGVKYEGLCGEAVEVTLSIVQCKAYLKERLFPGEER